MLINYFHSYLYEIYNFRKKMAKEIERKFLVRGEFKHLTLKEIQLKQGYLSTDPERIIRIRIKDDKAFITIKTPVKGTYFTRNEWEFEIPVGSANEVMNVCLRTIISKTRYLVPSGKHIIEVDVFHGKNEGLVVAEIELKSEDEVFIKPDWLGEEVTGRPEYFNSNLI